MDSEDMPDIQSVDAQMVSELRQTSKEAHERGLVAAARWSLDLLRSLTEERRSKPIPKPELVDPTVEQLREEETFELARKFVDEKQHARAVTVLDGLDSDRAVFLRVYCLYIVGEKKALRDWHVMDGVRRQLPTPVNPQIIELYHLIEDATDPWLVFLKALFLFRLSRITEAVECVLLSLASLPWNWSAWTLLGDCIHEPSQLATHLDNIALPAYHPAFQLFLVYMVAALRGTTLSELAVCDALLTSPYFPTSLWIMSLRARVLYSLHKHRDAEDQFDTILAMEPYRIDSLDVFADILFMMDNKEKLAMLSQFFLVLNRDRPEVCYLVGCHYSLRNEHEKAIKHFRRATELDRTFGNAWGMMGMEYIELNNPQAAIESLRRGVDVNPRDFRAWSGLAKAYEMLGMQPYALYYRSKALKLRPDEPDAWEEHSHSLEAVGKLEEALSAMKNALIFTQMAPATSDIRPGQPHPMRMSIALRLSHLFSLTGDHTAAAYHAQSAVREGESGFQMPAMQLMGGPAVPQWGPNDYATYLKALVVCAEHQIRLPMGDWGRAKEYLERVLGGAMGVNYTIDEVTQAKASELLKFVRTKLQMRAASEAARLD
ncbi:cell division control protein 23 [Roridomyces roridus]|uniref:Cell division control protein 23 n=1 Tax=Roridomyces roridus TaxID=1738132 RepID=A0AAD7CJW9_9AGAR|nr:cell division control protein 23 [Roridomyces roridus]